MNNLNLNTNMTWTGTTASTGDGSYCHSHGWNSCNCVPHSGTYIYPSSILNYVKCGSCNLWYDGSQYTNQHICPINFSYVGTTTTLTNWQIKSAFKEVKEITTDSELIYEWGISSFQIILPQQFSDCFLKVGYSWSPLYPLIFSACENDSKELSFHLVVGIIEKVFEGSKVILKGVSTTKIEDNLTLMQLTNRTRQYFEDK